MLIVLSPAKSLDFDTPPGTDKFTQPDYLPQSQQLVKQLKDFSPAKLASLMKISDKLATLNVARYGSWETPFTQDNAKQAMLSFTGDVYRGLDANSLDADHLDYAQGRVRILSGLYGILRPLDLMQPYRLEMGTKLVTEHGKNLYEFWGSQLHDAISGELSEQAEPVLIGSLLYYYNLVVASYYKDAMSELRLPTHFSISKKTWLSSPFLEKAEGYQRSYFCNSARPTTMWCTSSGPSAKRK